MSFHIKAFTCALLLSVCQLNVVFSQTKYQAPRAKTAPVIDGVANDACWANSPWYEVDQIWLGNAMAPGDFSGRFKLAWDADKLYVLAEIVDDVLNDYHSDPLSNYWEDDTWEIFLDEDASGGQHEFSHNAFAYHISLTYDKVDMDTDRRPKLFNDHVEVQRTSVGNNTYIWEAAFDVYTDAFVHGSTNNPKVTLTEGKIMGFAMAYCDNDGGATRQNFIGSEVINRDNKNVAYQDADVFGKVTLVEDIAPQFTHVRIATGLAHPTAFTIAKDGRIFIAEQAGRVRVIENGQLLSEPVLSISVNQAGPQGFSERGLIGITLDPDFATNNYMYIFYTTPNDPVRSRVVRYTLNGNTAITASAQTIIDLDPLSEAHNHNGGGLHFGQDGKLYIATGDNATPANSQNLDNTHGKILRLNPDGSIPDGNPFTSGSDQKKMIWVYGLRNPFTFDIQESTGKIYINDVGQERWEEINDATTAGQNFGWPTEEGMGSVYVNPVFTYPIMGQSECAITGGCFFEPEATNYPSKYQGKYFFMDYCANWIAVLDPATGAKTEVFSSNVASSPIGIDVHPDGNLYYLNRGSYDGTGIGSVYRIVYSGNLEPEIHRHPESQQIAESQPVSFSVQATGAVPLNYQWYKDGQAINGATSATYSIAYVLPEHAGEYSVMVSNTYNEVSSETATLTVTEFNSRPTASITSHENGVLFHGGQQFTFKGTGTDPEDGAIPVSHFKWKVDLHHDEHVHDGQFFEGSDTYLYTMSPYGHTETSIWYRVYLIVTDAGGLTDTTYIELHPQKSTMTFETVPPGLTITIDGQPFTTPLSVEGVVGVLRTFGVPSPQNHSGKGWAFESWSTGKVRNHPVSTPEEDTQYIITFKEVPLTEEALIPENDAYVQKASWRASDMDSLFGIHNSTELRIKNYTEDPDRETYIQYDLSKLNGDKDELISSYLNLSGFVDDFDGGVGDMKVNIYESSSEAWDENTITWRNKPAAGDLITSFTISDYSYQHFIIDVSDFVKRKIANESNLVTFILTIEGDLNINWIVLNSKEAGENVPTLTFTYPELVTSIVDFNAKSGQFRLFPNPAHKELTVQLNGQPEATSSIQILDQYSRTIADWPLTSATQRLDISHLDKGLYIVYYKNGSTIETQKLIVK